MIDFLLADRSGFPIRQVEERGGVVDLIDQFNLPRALPPAVRYTIGHEWGDIHCLPGIIVRKWPVNRCWDGRLIRFRVPGHRGFHKRPLNVISILKSLLGTVILLILLELGARTAGVPLGPFVIVPTSDKCLCRSRTLGMEFVPNCAATWSNDALTGTERTTFQTNSLGLRDAEIVGDEPRILAIGDSCTWGWQVAQNDAYPQVLQRLLDAEVGTSKYRIWIQ